MDRERRLSAANKLHIATLLFQRRMRWILVASQPPLGAFEAIVLSRLAQYPELTAGSLADTYDISKSKVARLLVRLEAAGYIDRLEAEEDKRRRPLSFTPLGKSMLIENDLIHAEVSKRGCQNLSNHQYQILVDYFDRLATGFGAPAEFKRPEEPPLAPHQRRMATAQRVLGRRYLDAEVDLSSFHILLEIYRHQTGITSFNELKLLLPMHPSKLSRTIDSLAKAQLIKKYAPSHDRRLLSVCFTIKGKELFLKWLSQIAERFFVATTEFTDDELEDFTGIIDHSVNSPIPKSLKPQVVIRKPNNDSQRREIRAFLVEQLVRERRHLSLGQSIIDESNYCSFVEVNSEIQGVAEITVGPEKALGSESVGAVRHFALAKSARTGEVAKLAIEKSVEHFFKESHCDSLAFPNELFAQEQVSEWDFNQLQTSRAPGFLIVHR